MATKIDEREGFIDRRGWGRRLLGHPRAAARWARVRWGALASAAAFLATGVLSAGAFLAVNAFFVAGAFLVAAAFLGS